MVITTRSEKETRDLGRRIGGRAAGGLVIGLFGELGSGKTVFVQGLARGMGIPEQTPVTSPTYTLINEYPGPLRLFHVDLYRISDSTELEDIGFDDIFTEDSVVAVEWAQRCPGALPLDRVEIRIGEAGPEERDLELSAGGQRSRDLLQALETQLEP